MTGNGPLAIVTVETDAQREPYHHEGGKSDLRVDHLIRTREIKTMQGQSNPGQRDFPESERGFEQDRDKQRQSQGGSQKDSGQTGTGTATGTAPQNPGTIEQNPGTSRQSQPTTDTPIRNPSGEDLSEGIDGDEGSGRGI